MSRQQTKTHRCGVCGKEWTSDAPPGMFVTRGGCVSVCSAACMVEGQNRPDACTLGELEAIERGGLN